jgi:zinc protease
MFGLAGPVASPGAQDLPVQKQVLDNGLTVLMTEMPQSPMVSVYALVKAGAATEGEFLGAGISHFLEHMLFKGTEKRTSEEIPQAIQSVGGTINAQTGQDYAMYTISVPHESFDVALDVLTDMVMHSTIDEADFVKERDVILNEMRLHEDNPNRQLYEITSRVIYIRHPYKEPVIGYRDQFKRITRDDMRRYYTKFYVPNNMILSVAGRFDPKAVLPKIKAAWADYPRGPSVVRNLPDEPQQISPRWYEEDYPTDLSRLTISFPSVSLLHKDLYALDVLAKILGQGKSSRLYKDIYKDKEWVYKINAFNYTPVDKGVFRVYAVLDYKNKDKVVDSVMAHLRKLRQEPVAAGELKIAKRKVLSEHVFGNQKSSQVAYLQAVDEAFAGDPAFSQKYVEAIRAVTPEDIQRVARQYLDPQARNVVILKPKGSDGADAPQTDSVKANAIEKITLDNGLTLLLREDHAFPLVSMRVVANGGLLQEPEALNGISRMMASLWTKATDSKTFADIARITDARGMRLGSYSGRYSFGMHIDCLTEDVDTGLDLLADFIKNPAFRQEEIPQIKADTLAEIRSLDDSIFTFTGRKLNKLLYPSYPLRRDVEGTPESVKRIQREDIMDFYERLGHPNNMVVSVFGDIDQAAVREAVVDKLGALPSEEIGLARPQPRPLASRITETYHLEKEQTMVMWAFRGVAMEHPDRYGLEVMTSLLGSSLSGRLFKAIREEFGEAYTLGAYTLPGRDVGSIKIYVLTNAQAVERVKAVVRREVERLKAELVPVPELDDVKAYLKGTHKASLETSHAQAFSSGLDELYGLGYDHFQEYDTRVDAVTPQDIQRLAETYCDFDRSVTVTTYPKDIE